jgi:Ulp1 family protease
MLKQMKEHPVLSCFCVDACREYDDLEQYNEALIKDDKAERAKRYSAPRTRARGTNKTISSENKLLVVYPFKVEEEVLRSISSQLTELSGDRLGVSDAAESASEIDDIDEGNEDGNEEEGQPRDTSTRTHYLTIREDDKERLQPGQFLNDTLVDFWMSW